MNKDEALRLALEALENSDDLVRENAYSAEQLYGNYPARQGKVRGLKALVEDHEKAITAIKAALEAKDEPVAHSVVAGALFDFMGWLTSREKRLILSSVDEASPAVEAITEFAKKRNLSLKYAEVGYWMEFLSTPPKQEAKDEPVPVAIVEVFGKDWRLDYMALPVGKHKLYAQQYTYTTPPQQEANDEPWEKFCDSHCVWTDHHPDCKLAKNEPVGLIESLKDAQPCCGQYATCWRACTPRGKFIGQRDAQRKSLTDEEIQDALEVEFLGSDLKRNWQDDLRVARAIEAAHGIKGEA